MGTLAEALKLYGNPDEWSAEVAPDRLEALAAGAAQFVRCGGSITLADFAQLSLTERAVLAAVHSGPLAKDPAPPPHPEEVLAEFMARKK